MTGDRGGWYAKSSDDLMTGDRGGWYAQSSHDMRTKQPRRLPGKRFMRITNKKQQIEMHLRAELQRGRWAVGEQLPVEDELIQELGVSRSTIREALNSLVSEGVIVRKHGIGTFVERIPASSIVVCAWFENLVSPAGYWYRDLVTGIRGLVESEHYSFDIIVGNGQAIDLSVSSVGKYINGPASRDFVGAINIMPNSNLDEQFSNLGIPVVSIQNGVPVSRYSVVLDYDHLLDMAIEITEDYGSNDFVVLYTDDPLEVLGESYCTERARWFRILVGDDKSRLIPVPSIPDAYDGFKEWWATRRSDTIFFMDDSVYEVASRAMLELGIRVPEDLRVITHANIGRQFHNPIQVDRVGFDVGDVVATAWEMLSRLVSGQAVDNGTVYVSGKCQRSDSWQLHSLTVPT